MIAICPYANICDIQRKYKDCHHAEAHEHTYACNDRCGGFNDVPSLMCQNYFTIDHLREIEFDI